MCDELRWNLAEEFFWFNPSKLPSPIEWVNKRKIRTKDAVNTVWWLSKTDFPKADVSRVLVPYSKRMKLLLKNSGKYYSPKKRPSGLDISRRFGEDKGGAIPPNLLNLIEIPNTESNSSYLRWCKTLGTKGHPARFPEALPEFFIRFLTDPGDIVLDIFAGSNTTGAVAEALGRRWLAFEMERAYLAASIFRFLRTTDENYVRATYEYLLSYRATLSASESFSPSKWTDQEVGFALALRKLVIPVKVNSDPHGFISRYQALPLSPLHVSGSCKRIVELVASKAELGERFRDSLIQKFADSDSFAEASENAKLLRDFEPYTFRQMKEIMQHTISNDQIHYSFGARKRLRDMINNYEQKNGIEPDLVQTFYEVISKELYS